MRRTALTNLLLTCAMASLSACGGGGGGSGFNSTPPPPPPPPPPPTTAVNIFPAITTSTQFAALGVELGGNPDAPVIDGFSVRYDAASNAYIFDLPSHAPSAFHVSGSQSDPSFWNGGLVSSEPGVLWPPVSVLKPTAANPLIELQYTSYAAYLSAGPMEDRPHGLVAFGSATSASAMPITGSATMEAIVAGQTSGTLIGVVRGTATLQFDFAAGTLAGRFDPVLYPYYDTASYALGQYTFANTVYGVGSATFSGDFSHANSALTGAFNGLFTGPNGEELMARWKASYFVPGLTEQPENMFGVWVGKDGGP